MGKNSYLATTALSRIWDMDCNLLLLGPWCLTGGNNIKVLGGKTYTFVPSPWEPATKIKEAADYCEGIYKNLLLQCKETLNSLHNVDYPVKYWQVLIGSWLLHFISIFYERYKRIENAIKIFPEFYTNTLALEEYEMSSSDTLDFFSNNVNDDFFNLKIFSLIAHNLCPEKTRQIEITAQEQNNIKKTDNIHKEWLFNNFLRTVNYFFKSPVVLSDTYHLAPHDMLSLKIKGKFKLPGFINFTHKNDALNKNSFSFELRRSLRITQGCDGFQLLLCRALNYAMPTCYLENYKFYKERVKNEFGPLKFIGSAVGWYGNERFKFFAAEAILKGAKTAEFQHGGGYGILLAAPMELMAREKDIFYSWRKEDKDDSLPSPHLSRLSDTHSSECDRILFIGTAVPKYHYRFHTYLFPDDVAKYFEDKRIFLNNLSCDIKKKIWYRPYLAETCWDEDRIIKEMYPEVNFLRDGILYKWMQKARVVVIDHLSTSFLEALSINVPCLFYWDREVFLVKPEAEMYIEILTDAGILYRHPEKAAQKLNEIYDSPQEWWLSNKVQEARKEFCNRYAYARKDWLKIWADELKRFL